MTIDVESQHSEHFEQWLKTERILSVVSAAIIFAAALYLELVYPTYARQLTFWEHLFLAVLVFAGIYELWNLQKPNFIRNKLAGMTPRQQYWGALATALFAVNSLGRGLVERDLPWFLLGVACVLLTIYSIWRARKAAKLEIKTT
jgi:hypothetical protein